MKRKKRSLWTYALFLLILIILIVYFSGKKSPTENSSLVESVKQFTVPNTTTNKPVTQSIFVPSWQITKDQALELKNQDYDRIIYFGVTGSEEGIVTDNSGYENLSNFVDIVGDGKKWLTVGMLNNDINDRVLADREAQLRIIEDAVSLAKQYSFEGVVLDFEHFSLFGNQRDSMTSFYKLFSEEVKKSELGFSITLYGDVYYRRRPYDVKKIASFADEVMIMAYDLHKSRGEPGPNFPILSGSSYGYGYDRLLSDISQEIPVEKITIIFGYYGYDWKIDNEERPITPGSAITAAQVKARYIDDCIQKDCKAVRDQDSGETKITYQDVENKHHIIWYEDEESVARKVKYLKSRGVTSYSYWAYGYF